MQNSPPPLAQPPAPPQLPPPVTPSQLTQDDRNIGMLCHLLAIFTGFLGPLILWLVKKDASPFVDFHGKEALNFQITLLIVTTVLGTLAAVLMIVFIGIILIPVIALVVLAAVILEIIACLAASRGEFYQYPFNIRFIQ